MIQYEEEWIVGLLFRVKGSLVLRASLFALPAATLAVALVSLDDWAPQFREDIGVFELKTGQVWTAFTAALSILLSFRTSQAMSRFWEGTSLLHQMRGEWFDAVSCCVSFSRSAKDGGEQVMNFRHTLVRLMSLCHGSALEEIKGDDESDEIEVIDVAGLDFGTLKMLHECKENYDFNRVELLLHLSQTCITSAMERGIIAVAPPILSRVYQTLSRGFVNLLNAKKICDTKFPFPYAQLIAILLLLNSVLTPLTIASLFQSKAFSFLFTFLPVFGFCSLNFIAIELENPFGNDDNDLPLTHFQSEMNRCLLLLLHRDADHIPTISEHCIKEFDSLMTPSCSESSPPPVRGRGRRMSTHEAAISAAGNMELGGGVASARSPRHSRISTTSKTSIRDAVHQQEHFAVVLHNEHQLSDMDNNVSLDGVIQMNSWGSLLRKESSAASASSASVPGLPLKTESGSDPKGWPRAAKRGGSKDRVKERFALRSMSSFGAGLRAVLDDESERTVARKAAPDQRENERKLGRVLENGHTPSWRSQTPPPIEEESVAQAPMHHNNHSNHRLQMPVRTPMVPAQPMLHLTPLASPSGSPRPSGDLHHILARSGSGNNNNNNHNTDLDFCGVPVEAKLDAITDSRMPQVWTAPAHCGTTSAALDSTASSSFSPKKGQVSRSHGDETTQRLLSSEQLQVLVEALTERLQRQVDQLARNAEAIQYLGKLMPVLMDNTIKSILERLHRGAEWDGPFFDDHQLKPILENSQV